MDFCCLFCLQSIVLIDLVIQGASLGITLNTFLGMKLDMILRNILVKDFTCQFGSSFNLKCLYQGKL